MNLVYGENKYKEVHTWILYMGKVYIIKEVSTYMNLLYGESIRKYIHESCIWGEYKEGAMCMIHVGGNTPMT